MYDARVEPDGRGSERVLRGYGDAEAPAALLVGGGGGAGQDGAPGEEVGFGEGTEVGEEGEGGAGVVVEFAQEALGRWGGGAGGCRGHFVGGGW